MKKQNENLTDAEILRQKAEEQLKIQPSKTSLSFSEADMLKLTHQLEVHQIQLEKQGKELAIAKEKAELAEEALKKSTVDLSHISENIDAIIWRYDIKNDKWLYVSPQAEKILGYAPYEWINFRWWIDNIHEDDQTWAPEFCINRKRLRDTHS